MEHTEDGGPAFPVAYSNEVDGPTVMPSTGMTKREVFAAQAMKSFIGRWAGHDSFNESGVFQRCAEHSCEMADAMLEALAQPAEPEPLPPYLTYDAYVTPAAQHEALKRISERADFSELPDWLRQFVNVATNRIEQFEDGIPF